MGWTLRRCRCARVEPLEHHRGRCSWERWHNRPDPVGVCIKTHVAGAAGEIEVFKKLWREQAPSFFAGHQKGLVASDVFARAHFWARELALLVRIRFHPRLATMSGPRLLPKRCGRVSSSCEGVSPRR